MTEKEARAYIARLTTREKRRLLQLLRSLDQPRPPVPPDRPPHTGTGQI